MRKKYLLCPGRVESKTDGQDHWISATALIHLYGVKASECALMGGPADPKLIPLTPRYHGDYREWLATRTAQ